MPRKVRPRLSPAGLSGSDALTEDERAALSEMAGELTAPVPSPAGLVDKLARVAITYRLMRQQDAGAGGERPWAPQGLKIAEQRRKLEHLSKSLANASESILSLDTPLRELLDVAYHSARPDTTVPTGRKIPHDPLAESGKFEDDQHALEHALDRMAAGTSIALHLLLPPVGGRPSLGSLRWAIGELKKIYTGATGREFSVGEERDSVDALNWPARWVGLVVKIIDPDVTIANIRTVLR